MPTKEEPLRGFIDNVGLGVTRICQRLYEGLTIFLMFSDILLKASESHLPVSPALAVGLRRVRGNSEVFSAMEGA